MANQHTAYRAVVFDMDGVIFDSERLVIETWKVVADKYHIQNIDQACLACTGLNKDATAVKMREIYGEQFPYEEYKKEASALFHERYDDGRLPMKPGVTELLTFLKEQGIRIALASSTRSGIVKKELADAGIIGYFDEIVCGDMVARSKPAPDIFLKACECLGVQPPEAYGIEDSYNGIRSAHTAGLCPIMVPDLCPPTEEMEQLAEVILPSLSAVKDYLSFGEKEKELFDSLGESRQMVLSTSLEDHVTSRMMSMIIHEGAFYFQTDRNFRKYAQLIGNPQVALCADNIQIEGICTEIGTPAEHPVFSELYRKHFSGSYRRYSGLENERLFLVEPVYIQKWIYENSKPFVESYDFKTFRYEKEAYEV